MCLHLHDRAACRDQNDSAMGSKRACAQCGIADWAPGSSGLGREWSGTEGQA